MIEQKIEALTLAIVALTAAISKGGGSAPSQSNTSSTASTETVDVTAEEPKKEKKKKEAAPAPAEDDGDDSTVVEAVEITAETLRELAKQLITKNKTDDIKAVLKKHEAASLTVLDKKHYKSVDASLRKLLSA